MVFVTRHHETHIEGAATAHALRRYVVARAAGRTAAEYVRLSEADGVAAWIGCTLSEAGGPVDGHLVRQVRRPGLPWCRWLGADTSIASDHELQAYFELVDEDDGHGWTRLRAEVSRDRRGCLRRWRARGREILDRIRAQREAGLDVARPPRLADKYRISGKGLR